MNDPQAPLPPIPDDEAARRASDVPSVPPPEESTPPVATPPPARETPPRAPLPTTPLPATPLPTTPPPPPARGGGGRCLLFAVLGLIACALLTGVVAVGVVLFGVSRVDRSLQFPFEGGVSEVETRSFDAGASPNLVVRNRNGRTEVRTGDVRAIQIEATKRAVGPNAQELLRQIQLDMSQSGDTVRLGYTTPTVTGFSLGGGGSVDFLVTVPANTTIDIEANNGEIVVDGVRAATTVKNDNGAITLRNIDGATSAQTQNGRLTLSRVRGRLDAQSTNGPIDIQDAQADNLRLRNNNGPITYVGSLGEGAHEIRSSNGRVSVTVPADQKLRLDVQTGNGSITNRMSLSDARIERNRLSGTLNGGGPTLTIRTDNGSVTLETR